MTIKKMSRRRVAWLVCAGLWAVCASAGAQAQRSYAVLSLCADKFFVVQPQMTTGSSLDRNVRSTHQLPDDSIEMVAVSAAEAAVKKAEPGASVGLYITRDPALYGALGAEDGSVRDMPRLLGKLKALVEDSKASHLILISRHRHPARFRVTEGYIGVGRVYGVGFYVDEGAELRSTETGERRGGFVGPYAAVKVQLIDLADGRVVSESASLASEMHAAPLSANSAWAAMPAVEKLRAMQQVVQQAVHEGVSKALKAS